MPNLAQFASNFVWLLRFLSFYPKLFKNFQAQEIQPLISVLTLKELVGGFIWNLIPEILFFFRFEYYQGN